MGIALSLMFAWVAPSGAAAATSADTAGSSAGADTRAATRVDRTVPPVHRSCGPGVNLRIAERCAVNGPQQFSEGGCGFLQRCVYLNRTEQTYLITGSKWIVQAALCAGSIGLGCVAAGTVVELAAQWLLNRGGICPTSKPKLRVQYLPWPTVEGCVA